MTVSQGEIYWIDFDEPAGSEPGYRRPFLVIQNDLFNTSAIGTVVVCALTTNLKRANAPGNVVLEKGEANLPKKSVVNVSQIFTVDQSELQSKIGTLDLDYVREVLQGVSLVLEPRSVD